MITWKVKPFSEVVTLQRGHDLPAKERRPGVVPILGSFGVTGSHDQAKYPAPGISVGRSGAAIGTATFVNEPFWPLNTCLFVRDFKDNDPRWLYYLLVSIDFTQFNSGSAQPSLNRNFLRDISILVPPIAEQQAIAEVLGALDDKITANNKLITTSNNLALSLLHTCQASVPLSEIVTHKKGSIGVSALGASAVAHFSLPAFDADKLPDLCNPDEIKSNKAYIQSPSVLISKLNPHFPRVWNLPELPEEPAVASTEFLVLEPKFSSTSVLWAILSQEQFKRAVETKVAGTSGSHQRVKPTDLLATKAIDPRDIGSESKGLIEDLCQTSFHLQYENRHLETTRDALLPHLMSGKIRVREAESIVEGVL